MVDGSIGLDGQNVQSRVEMVIEVVLEHVPTLYLLAMVDNVLELQRFQNHVT